MHSRFGYIQATVSDVAAELAWVSRSPLPAPGIRNRSLGLTVAKWILDYFKVAELRASIHPDQRRLLKEFNLAHVGLRPSGELGLTKR